jgi:hypothetical protein
MILVALEAIVCCFYGMVELLALPVLVVGAVLGPISRPDNCWLGLAWAELAWRSGSGGGRGAGMLAARKHGSEI